MKVDLLNKRPFRRNAPPPPFFSKKSEFMIIKLG